MVTVSLIEQTVGSKTVGFQEEWGSMFSPFLNSSKGKLNDQPIQIQSEKSLLMAWQNNENSETQIDHMMLCLIMG